MSEDNKDVEAKAAAEASASTDAAKEKAAEVQQANPSEQTTSEPSDAPAAELMGPSDEEKEAKAKAAAEARAARANARAAQKGDDAAPTAPKEPSPKQPLLDQVVRILKEHIHEDAVEEAYINEKNDHLPYIIIKSENWFEAAQLLKNHSELKLSYLRNVSGVDQETHLEVAYHLRSLSSDHELCIKVKTDREHPAIPSVTPVWATANWNEREIYDLFGIDFPGHPHLVRIMMSDDWVGHPLRKDYEPIDPEV
jgi:NADH-quinone oxidoreductase subunit C